MSESAEWLAAHQGEFLRRVGHVWECGDDDCGCEQAVVIAYYRNKVVPRARVPVGEWAGEFRTDHEPGADEDLVAHRHALRESDPDLEASIEWQGGIDYGIESA